MACDVFACFEGNLDNLRFNFKLKRKEEEIWYSKEIWYLVF